MEIKEAIEICKCGHLSTQHDDDEIRGRYCFNCDCSDYESLQATTEGSKSKVAPEELGEDWLDETDY